MAAANEVAFGEWIDLFDGESLEGWKAIPRLASHQLLRTSEGNALPKDELTRAVEHWNRENGTPQEAFDHVGEWKIHEGVIVGGQRPAGSGYGAYLITDREFGNFELEYEIRPDWPTDTGVLVRQHPIGTIGFQILCDHRPGGGIGGIYTNSLGSYRAAPFVVDGDAVENFSVKNFREGEQDKRFARSRLRDATSFDAFRTVWNLNDWNRFRVRCFGATPKITVWINDLKIGTLDAAAPGPPKYDASLVERRVGSKGHIGLEVHSNNPKFGWNQWGQGAVSRWRNIRVREFA